MSPRRFIFLTYSSWSLESNTWRADNIYILGAWDVYLAYSCSLNFDLSVTFEEYWTCLLYGLYLFFCGRKDMLMQTCSWSFLFWYTYISFHSRFGRKNSPPFGGSGFITASDLAACRASVFGTKGGTNKNREKPTLPETNSKSSWNVEARMGLPSDRNSHEWVDTVGTSPMTDPFLWKPKSLRSPIQMPPEKNHAFSDRKAGQIKRSPHKLVTNDIWTPTS